MPRSRQNDLPLAQSEPRILNTEEAAASGGSTPIVETRASIRGTRNSAVVTPPGGVLLPVGVYNLFCLPASFNVMTANPPLRGRIVVEQLPSGEIRESWVMFSTYLPPSATNSVWIVPNTNHPARTQRDLYVETTNGPNADGAICASWQLIDPRANPGSVIRQIDAGTVEIIASTPTGPTRVGQVIVTAPAGFVGQWTTASVNNGSTAWTERWAVLRAAPQATAWRLRHVPPASAPQIQQWVNSVNVVYEPWLVLYSGV